VTTDPARDTSSLYPKRVTIPLGPADGKGWHASLRPPERFGAWYAGIALNVARRWLRDAIDTAGLSDDWQDSHPRPDEAAEAQELARRVRRAVERLAPGQRQAVLVLLGWTHARRSGGRVWHQPWSSESPAPSSPSRLDPVLLRPPPPRGRSPPGSGQCHRSSGHGGTGADASAHEAIWAPIGYDGARMRLAELAEASIPAESHRRLDEAAEHRRRVAEQPQ
jgi:hypothetical protein